MQSIVIRVQHETGQFWIEVNIDCTFGFLYKKIAEKLQIHNQEFPISFDGQNFKIFQQNSLVSTIINLQDGLKIFVKQSLFKKQEIKIPEFIQQEQMTKKCNHLPHQKCINCLQQQTEVKNQCNHSKDTSCPLCQKEEKYVEKKLTGKCDHAKHQKCIHCLTVKSQNIKHISFDEFIELNYHNCVNHKDDQKCTNCLINLFDDYQVNKDCKNHEAYPKGMCSKCIPPLIQIKRQEYWHVDYVQIMNDQEIQDLISYWLKTFNQWIFYMYGYYAEDPIYYKGVWAVVEYIYEPPQENQFNDSLLLRDNNQILVDRISAALNMEFIGWGYTTMMNDVFMSGKESLMAAYYQNKNKVHHPIGVEVSKQISLILWSDAKNSENVHPEAYMISDDLQNLYSNNLIQESQDWSHLQVIWPKQDSTFYSQFIKDGKPIDQVEVDFFLVNIAVGQAKDKEHSIMNNILFPPSNRNYIQKPSMIKEYLQKSKTLDQNKRFCNFQFLLFLAKVLDIETVCIICKHIANNQEIPSHIVQLIESLQIIQSNFIFFLLIHLLQKLILQCLFYIKRILF